MKTIFPKLIRFSIVAVVALATLCIARPAQAATRSEVFSLSANTPLTVLTGAGKTVTQLLIAAGTTNCTVKAYDSVSNTTNIVRAAYTSYAQVSTNWSQVFTNATGIVITNTFTGVAVVGTVNSAVTNERPTILQSFVPASTVRTIETAETTGIGFTLLSSAAATVEVTYRQ